jgi:hypothetical protein
LLDVNWGCKKQAAPEISNFLCGKFRFDLSNIPTKELCSTEIVSESTVSLVRFEVFTVVIMKNAVSWDVTPCGSYKNRRFGGNLVFLRSVRRLLVQANVVLSSPILFTVVTKAMLSSETSVLRRATRRITCYAIFFTDKVSD